MCWMWHLCTEMSKEDHLIITKKIEYTLCGHSVIMNKRRDCTLRSSLNVQPLFSFGIACFKGIHHAYSFLRSVYGTLLPIPEDI